MGKGLTHVWPTQLRPASVRAAPTMTAPTGAVYSLPVIVLGLYLPLVRLLPAGRSSPPPVASLPPTVEARRASALLGSVCGVKTYFRTTPIFVSPTTKTPIDDENAQQPPGFLLAKCAAGKWPR